MVNARIAPDKVSEFGVEGGATQDITQLEKYFAVALKEIYWAEKYLIKALPKMRKVAAAEDLKLAIEEHLFQTKEHLNRLEQIFRLIGKKVQAKKSEAIVDLVKEGESLLEQTEAESMTRDMAIILAAQKVEQYVIAKYRELVQMAKVMDLKEPADILSQTLVEERQVDQDLSEIAEHKINW